MHILHKDSNRVNVVELSLLPNQTELPSHFLYYKSPIGRLIIFIGSYWTWFSFSFSFLVISLDALCFLLCLSLLHYILQILSPVKICRIKAITIVIIIWIPLEVYKDICPMKNPRSIPRVGTFCKPVSLKAWTYRTSMEWTHNHQLSSLANRKQHLPSRIPQNEGARSCFYFFSWCGWPILKPETSPVK